MFLDNSKACEIFLEKCMQYTSTIEKFGKELLSGKVIEIISRPSKKAI